MSDHIAVFAVLVGIGATVVMDLWALAINLFFNIPFRGFGLVGRWLLHMRHGQFLHPDIRASAPMRYEEPAGWIFHYLTGMAFSFLFIIIAGEEWSRQPTFVPAMAAGLLTLAAPFFIMQPCWGLGLASSHVPDRWKARGRSLINHLSFGAGLYLAGRLLVWL